MANASGSRKMAAVVAQRIREKIARGELAPGDPLPPETTLLETYDVARPTMRAALRILESEGLLTVKMGKGGGPRISLPRVDSVAKPAGVLLQVQGASLADVMSARRIIESPLLDNFEALTREHVLTALDENVEAASAFLGDDDGIRERGVVLHDEFHRIIMRAAGGLTLQLFHALLESIVDRSSRAYFEGPTSAHRRRDYAITLETHRDILSALREADREKATARWNDHLVVVENNMLSASIASTAIDLFG